MIMISEYLCAVYMVGVIAHQFRTINRFLAPIQIIQHMAPFHPLGHHATLKQPRGYAFNPQDVRVVHPPGYNHLLAIFLKFQADTQSEILWYGRESTDSPTFFTCAALSSYIRSTFTAKYSPVLFTALQTSEYPPDATACWPVVRIELTLCDSGSSPYISQTLLNSRTHRSWISDSGERIPIA